MDKIEFERKEVEEMLKALGDIPFKMSFQLIQFLDQKLNKKQPEKASTPNG